MENKFLEVKDFMEISETGNWLVDELIEDPHFLSSGCVVKDRGQFYFVRNGGIGGKSKAEALTTYNASPVYPRAKHNHEFFMRGLEPRPGFAKPEVLRAITAAEFSELVKRFGLTDDDISEKFTETKGGLYGSKAQVSITVKQIRPSAPGAPLQIEGELREKGIEAFSSSAGRVNIRVE